MAERFTDTLQFLNGTGNFSLVIHPKLSELTMFWFSISTTMQTEDFGTLTNKTVTNTYYVHIFDPCLDIHIDQTLLSPGPG